MEGRASLDVEVEEECCLRVPIAVKRHHQHGKSYKSKHLIVVAYSLRGSVHYHHSGTWQHAGRCGAGEAAENPTSCRQQE